MIRKFKIFCNKAIVVTVISLVLIGCSKSDKNGDEGDFYFRFKANGTQVDYNTTINQAYYPGTTSVNTTTPSVPGFSAVISATKDINQTLRDAISVVMTGPVEFTTGTDYTTASNSGLTLMQFGYYDNSGKLFVMSTGLNLVNNPGNATVRYSIINDDIIQGQFSANIYDNTTSSNVQITEGEFRVKRKP